MTTVTPPPNETWRSELDAMLVRLRDETLLQAMVWLFVLSLALLGLRLWREMSQTGVTMLLVLLIMLCGWVALRRRYLVAAWILVAGLTGLIFLSATWGGIEAATWLLALPVGLATLTISARAGVLLAAVGSVALAVAPAELLPVSGIVRAVAATGMWGVAGMVWLALRCVATSLRWAWASYEQAQTLLEQLRDERMQVQQTLEDLEAANTQLGLMNRLAAGLRQEADEARRTKERFVANVSHELRTPLNMIIGFTEMIVASPHTYGRKLPPALLADLDVIRRNSQQLSELVNDVLDLSQIEARQMALTRERCAVREIIEAAVTAVRPLYESKGLSLCIEMAEEVSEVYCDRLRIREVVLNLLSNAGRFTEQGGVTVRVGRAEGDLLVSVRDTGPGIAPEQLEKLFEPFWQADRTVGGRKGGSGLGLSISRSFVELHGGRIWCESEAGGGTSVSFTLPLEPPASPPPGAQRWLVENWPDLARTRRSRSPRHPARARFLIMDASGLLQRLIGRYFHGADALTVTSPEDALTSLAVAPANALLINDAYADDAATAARWRAQLPEGVPLVTCHLPGIPDSDEEMGVSGYLVKPITRTMLLQTLDRIPLRGKTVLVVEDDPDALQLFWRLLESAGRDYRVLTASDGQEALRVMSQQTPDIVFLDLVMPKMDGFEVLAARQRDPVLRAVPFIVTSARDPLGRSVASDGLRVTQAGGLALHELLACIDAVTTILSPLGLSTLDADASAASAPASGRPASAALTG